MAARLVDRLLRVINPRIAEVQKARRILSELLDYSTSTEGSHRRAERICALWAETITATQSEKRARHTLDQLIAIRQRLLALKDSRLYGQIPCNADVSDSLKRTNILSTDPVYKYVAILWLEWSRHTTRRQKAPADILGEYRAFCESFNHYCLLLVVRALSQLGVSVDASAEEHQIGIDATIRLSKKDLTLTVLSSGAIQIGANGRVLMSFVPLPAAMNRARSDEELDIWLRDLYSVVPSSGQFSSTVVLYLSTVAGSSRTLSAAANMRLQTVGNEPRVTSQRNFGFMPVSPWEIDCVERVGRCLRWAVTGRDLLRYPVMVNAALPSQLKARELPRWLFGAGNKLRMLRHPRPHEWRATGIDVLWQTAKQALDAAEAEEERVVAKLERGRTAPHQRRALAQDVTRSRKAVADARTAYQQVDLFRREICRILDDTIDISGCPVCGTPADTALGFRWDLNFYEFGCNDCNAQWGVRTCRCGERIPFLQAGPTISDNDRAPGWVDRYLGRDVLTIPQGEGAFECSACGHAV